MICRGGGDKLQAVEILPAAIANLLCSHHFQAGIIRGKDLTRAATAVRETMQHYCGSV
jgi:hypothetical protein